MLGFMVETSRNRTAAGPHCEQHLAQEFFHRVGRIFQVTLIFSSYVEYSSDGYLN